MPLYDALVHAFATAGTGGFSSKTLSIGAYGSVFIDVIITVFMFLFGINFTLYYHTLKGNFRSFFKNEEFRFYIGLVFASIIAITLNLVLNGFYSFGEGLRHSAFQVNSIISTTGYSTTDFNLWPVFSKFILVMLMFIGPSAGSTGGSVNVSAFSCCLKL